MANTINPNSFFNQEDDGTASSALALAQKTFNITETIKAQVDSLIGNLDAFKLEFDEYNTENTTNITKIFNDYSTLTERVDNVGNDVDAVSKVFFDFQGAQEREKKESLIQAEREAEAERDKNWEERDKQQKTKEEKGGKGGRAGGAVEPKSSAALDANDGVTKDGTEKERGFRGKLGQGLISPVTGLMHLTAAAGGTLTHGLMAGMDWLTGNSTDFDAGGGEKKDIPGTKMFKGLKNMFGGGDKKDSSSILGPTGDKKGKGLFGGLFGRKKDEKGEDAETKAIGNLNERLVAIENEAGVKKENKGLFGGKKDESDPIQESFEKNKENKFQNFVESGGILGGMSRMFGGGKDTKEEKGSKGKERVVYRGNAGTLRITKGTGVYALSKEEAMSQFLSLKNKDKKSRKENFKFKNLSIVLNDKFGVNTKDIQTNVKGKSIIKDAFGEDEMGLIKDGTENIKPATREQSLMESLVEPPPELSSLPPETDQPGNEGDPEEDASVEGEQEPAGAANNEEAIPAQGTSCSIECIQVSKSNSTALLMY